MSYQYLYDSNEYIKAGVFHISKFKVIYTLELADMFIDITRSYEKVTATLYSWRIFVRSKHSGEILDLGFHFLEELVVKDAIKLYDTLRKSNVSFNALKTLEAI